MDPVLGLCRGRFRGQSGFSGKFIDSDLLMDRWKVRQDCFPRDDLIRVELGEIGLLLPGLLIGFDWQGLLGLFRVDAPG